MRETEGVSTRYLLGAFFAVVLLCAVFFSLGYFLGYREGHPPGSPLTERVAGSSDVPAPVNASSSTPSDPSTTQPSESPKEPATATDVPGSSPDAAPGSNGSTPAGTAPAVAPTAGTREATTAPPSGLAPPSLPASATDSSPSGDIDESRLSPRSVPSGFLIQVGAVTSRQQALTMEQGLRSRGFPALVLTPRQVRANDGFLRVIAGPYKTREAAGAALRKLAAAGYKPFIRQ
jgi:septal ring-binding cell division protein DamX